MSRQAVARTDTGRVREGNEDRWLVKEHGATLLMAVADGVGGAPGGEVAADAAVQTMGERFFALAAGTLIEDRLAEGIREANTAVLRAAEASGMPSAASTIVAAAVQGDRVVVANLGDSRAYLVRDGAARQLTDDHSAGIANGITRFVGDPRGVQPDVFVEELRAGDRIVLCSDGLTRHVEPPEIAAHAATDDLDGAADALIALANSRGGEDNVTVLICAAARRGRLSPPSGRALAFGIFFALVLLVVLGAIAVLFSLRPPG